MASSTCKFCGRAIGWVQTSTGERMPVEPGIRSFIIPRTGETHQGFETHFGNCEKYQEQDKKKKKKPSQ